MSADAQKVRRLLGKPELRILVDRLQRGLERENLGQTLSFAHIDPATRRALEGLLGRRPGQGGRLSIRVDELSALLRHAGAADSLADAVSVLRGPLQPLRRQRDAAERAWQELFDRLLAGDAADPQRRDWLLRLRGDGLLKRLSAGDPEVGRQLLTQARRVLQRLPAAGLSRSHLAAQALGDAHALDAGRPVSALVRRYLRQSDALPGDAEDGEGERALWASAGVLVGGGVTSRVLCLNLPEAGRGGTGRMLGILAEAGQPALLTLRQLVTDPPAWRCPGRPVFICENPSVLAAAADRLGRSCAPLVCGDGQPGSAVHLLLQGLREAGARLYYHGDFDWPGIGIGNALLARHPIHAWHFDAASYRHAPESTKPLRGRSIEARWDAQLAAAMRERGMAVEEELLMDRLLQDLGD